MWLLLPSLAVGLLLGRLLRPDPRVDAALSWLSLASLTTMLLLMGVSLGGDAALWRQLPALGGRAVSLAVAAVFGSVAAAWLVQRHVLAETVRERDDS